MIVKLKYTTNRNIFLRSKERIASFTPTILLFLFYLSDHRYQRGNENIVIFRNWKNKMEQNFSKKTDVDGCVGCTNYSGFFHLTKFEINILCSFARCCFISLTHSIRIFSKYSFVFLHVFYEQKEIYPFHISIRKGQNNGR